MAIGGRNAALKEGKRKKRGKNSLELYGRLLGSPVIYSGERREMCEQKRSADLLLYQRKGRPKREKKSKYYY